MSVWRLLGRPSLRPVWESLHATLERDGEARSVRLDGLQLATRGDLQGLLGLPARPPADYRLNLQTLNTALARAEAGADARAVVERLVGPIVDRRGVRAATLASDSIMWERARTGTEPRLHAWLDELRGTGLLKAAATKTGRLNEDILARAIACATALPAKGTLLQVLASEKTGDPHALDQNRPLAALVLRAAARMVGWEDIARNATERRWLWSEVGVLMEGHSSDVLVHAFSAVGEGAMARHLRERAEKGLPRRITLAELQDERLHLPAGSKVFIVENPSVVDVAARRYQGLCQPIICLDGEPTVAVWELLAMLQNCRLHFHTDYDPAGVRIANRVFHRAGAAPWKYDAGHYEVAVASKHAAALLDGTVNETPWDPGLAEAMRRLGVAVFEEDVIEDLVDDLAVEDDDLEAPGPF